ncbi:MAG: hypothetical protein VX112_04545 [Pseudomonadota bacterium]|nr:hypothetical protein [Pseudomonadota bacterium]
MAYSRDARDLKDQLYNNIFTSSIEKMSTLYTPEAQKNALLEIIGEKIDKLRNKIDNVNHRRPKSEFFFGDWLPEKLNIQNNYLSKQINEDIKSAKRQIYIDIILRDKGKNITINGHEEENLKKKLLSNSTNVDIVNAYEIDLHKNSLDKVDKIIQQIDSNEKDKKHLADNIEKLKSLENVESTSHTSLLFENLSPEFTKKIIYALYYMTQSFQPDIIDKLIQILPDSDGIGGNFSDQNPEHFALWRSDKEYEINSNFEIIDNDKFKTSYTSSYDLIIPDLYSGTMPLISCRIKREYVIDDNIPAMTQLKIEVSDIVNNVEKIIAADKKLEEPLLTQADDVKNYCNKLIKKLEKETKVYKEQYTNKKKEDINQLERLKRKVQTTDFSNLNSTTNDYKDIAKHKKILLALIKRIYAKLGFSSLPDFCQRWEEKAKQHQHYVHTNIISELKENSTQENKVLKRKIN